MKEEHIYLKQTKYHILTRGNGWKNKKIPDCTIAELLTKLMLTVLLQIVLVIYSKKKSYSLMTKITKEVRHREITESNKNFYWCKIIDASILQLCFMVSLCKCYHYELNVFEYPERLHSLGGVWKTEFCNYHCKSRIIPQNGEWIPKRGDFWK